MAVPSLEPSPGLGRADLAQLVLDAALSVPGVLGTDPGPEGDLVTKSGDRVLTGVAVVAEPGGAFGLALGLRVALTDLPALADRVRLEVLTRAGSRGGRVVRVDVVVCDLVGEAAP